MPGMYGALQPAFDSGPPDSRDTRLPPRAADANSHLDRGSDTTSSSQPYPPPSPATSRDDDRMSTTSAASAPNATPRGRTRGRVRELSAPRVDTPFIPIALPSLPADLAGKATHFPYAPPGLPVLPVAFVVDHVANSPEIDLVQPRPRRSALGPITLLEPIGRASAPSPESPPMRSSSVPPLEIPRLIGIRSRIPLDGNGLPIGSRYEILRDAERALRYCEVCECTFDLPHHAEAHVNTHKSFFPFICAGGCRGAFTTLADRRRHWIANFNCMFRHEEKLLEMAVPQSAADLPRKARRDAAPSRMYSM